VPKEFTANGREGRSLCERHKVVKKEQERKKVIRRKRRIESITETVCRPYLHSQASSIVGVGI
jgi:hypothetical protein